MDAIIIPGALCLAAWILPGLIAIPLAGWLFVVAFRNCRRGKPWPVVVGGIVSSMLALPLLIYGVAMTRLLAAFVLHLLGVNW